LTLLAVWLMAVAPALAQKGKLNTPDARASDKNPAASGDAAEAAFELGRTAAKDKQWKKALVHYNEALLLKPGLVPALMNRGMLYLSLGNAKSAYEDFHKATLLRREMPEAYSWMALSQLLRNEPDSANVSAEKALRLDGRQSLAWYVRGQVQFVRGEPAEGINFLARAAQLGPIPLENKIDATKVKNRDDGKQTKKPAVNNPTPLATAQTEPQEPTTPAQRAAWDRMVEAKKAYDRIDNLIANSNRPRFNPRLPAGAQMPIAQPVPQEWLQQRAAALAEWQEATNAYKATR
jgi:tetratricopeptide (TPR) repeat protein